MIQDTYGRLYKNFVVKSFDSRDLLAWRKEWQGIPLSVFTEKELDFQQYGPSIFYAINRQRQTNLPIDKAHLRRQFEADLIAQFAVLDGAVKEGYYDEDGWIDSKVRALIKLDFIGKDLGEELQHVTRTWAPEFPSPEDLAKTDSIHMPTELTWLYPGYSPNWIKRIQDKRSLVYQLKQVYSQMLKNHRVSDPNRKNLRSNPERKTSGLVDLLKERFGDKIGVVLYGSATFSSETFNDYDLLVLVDNIRPEYYARLENNPIIFEGKNVDTVIVRKSDWEKYVVMSPFSLGIVKKGIILEGDVCFPELDEREAILRVISRATGRMRTLHNIALNWAAVNPAELKDRKGLLKSMSKVPRYILSACLQLQDLNDGRPHVQYENCSLDEKLAGIGIKKVEFNYEAAIPRNLLQLMEDTAEIVERFYKPNWIDSQKDQVKILNAVTKDMQERFKCEKEISQSQKEFAFEQSQTEIDVGELF